MTDNKITTNQTPSNKSSLVAFHKEGEGENTRWTEIDAVWLHYDGKGYNVKPKLIPTNWYDAIFCRKSKAKVENSS